MERNLYQCQHCNSELVYDKTIEKYRCHKCGAIFSIKINLEQGCVDVQEWGECEKPDRWDNMTAQEQYKFLCEQRMQKIINNKLKEL